MRAIIKVALSAAAMAAMLAMAGRVEALPLLQSPKITPANDAPAPVGYYYRRPGGVFGPGGPFGFDAYYGRGRLSFGYTSPYFGFGFFAPYNAPTYSRPYYAPGIYAPVPYSPQLQYEPAPYSYEAQPYQSDPTGRCSSGQRYRYPVGCVPN